VIDFEIILDTIRNIPMLNKIEKVKRDILRKLISFQPALGHTAYRAPGAVFEYYLRLIERLLLDLFQLGRFIK
jgi:hypothetical protein